MQSPDFYKRLGACMNLALAGSTEGERESAQAAVNRLLAKLTPAEIHVIMRGLPGASQASNHPPRVTRRNANSKRLQIIELLNQGLAPKDIARRLNTRVQYVYHVRKNSV